MRARSARLYAARSAPELREGKNSTEFFRLTALIAKLTGFTGKLVWAASKPEQASGEGWTVLFVSHNMAAINRLCSKGIWLQNGQAQRVGVTAEYYVNAI